MIFRLWFCRFFNFSSSISSRKIFWYRIFPFSSKLNYLLIFFRGWWKAFSFRSVYWRQNICYLFCSRSCGRRFKFFIDEIRVLEGFLKRISLFLSNTFCKLGTVWISMMPIIQNIFFWYQFELKNVSVILFFLFFFG